MTDKFLVTPFPSTPEEHRWHRFLNAAGEKWGYERVAAAEVYAAFDLRVGCDAKEFERLSTGRHARQINADITHFLRFAPSRGGLYRVLYGALLPFVPVESGGKLRRVSASAKSYPTLWDEPTSATSNAAGATSLSRIRSRIDPLADTDLIDGAHTLNGVGFLEFTLEHHWLRIVPEFRAWFSANATLESLLQTAVAQSSAGWH